MGTDAASELTSATARDAAVFDMMERLATDAVGHPPDNGAVVVVAEGFRHRATADAVRAGVGARDAARALAARAARSLVAPAGLYDAVLAFPGTPEAADGRFKVGPRAFRTRRADAWMRLHALVHPGKGLADALYSALESTDVPTLTVPAIYTVATDALSPHAVDRAGKATTRAWSYLEAAMRDHAGRTTIHVDHGASKHRKRSRTSRRSSDTAETSHA